MKPIIHFATLAAAAAVSGGCVREARIVLPSDVAAATEAITLSGAGAAYRGDFRLGASQGHFTRSDIEETEDGGRLVRKRGGGRFEISGPEFEGRLDGECSYRQAELDSGVVTAAVQRFAYFCGFTRNGRPADSRLVLEAVPDRPGKLLSGITRAGEVRMEGAVLTIRAIHHFEGGRVRSGSPLGYMFHVGSRRVGAIDINRSPKVVYAPRSGPERQAVLAAGVALALLRDPGE